TARRPKVDSASPACRQKSEICWSSSCAVMVSARFPSSGGHLSSCSPRRRRTFVVVLTKAPPAEQKGTNGIEDRQPQTVPQQKWDDTVGRAGQLTYWDDAAILGVVEKPINLFEFPLWAISHFAAGSPARSMRRLCLPVGWPIALRKGMPRFAANLAYLF